MSDGVLKPPEQPTRSRTQCCAICLSPKMLGKRACQECGATLTRWIGSPHCECIEIPGCPACNPRLRPVSEEP